jgi:hypothetical protein
VTTVDQQKIRRTRTGLIAHDPKLVQSGYTLFAPMPWAQQLGIPRFSLYAGGNRHSAALIITRGGPNRPPQCAVRGLMFHPLGPADLPATAAILTVSTTRVTGYPSDDAAQAP